MQYKIIAQQKIKVYFKNLYWAFFFFLFFLIPLQAVYAFPLHKLKKGQYEENLAPYRVIFHKVPKSEKKCSIRFCHLPLDQTQTLNNLLKKQKTAYEQTNSLKGYTIQAYMGSSRKMALNIQDRATILQSTYVPKLIYRQPYYIVRLGFFAEHFEAYIVYISLVKQLPNMMICPCTIDTQIYLEYKHLLKPP